MLKSGSNVAFEEVGDSGVVALAAIKVRYYREGKYIMLIGRGRRGEEERLARRVRRDTSLHSIT
jgi:hypothetical protein